jgi:hypothetical protein
MMEAVRTSETSVDNHFTRQYNPEDNSEHASVACYGTAVAFSRSKHIRCSSINHFVSIIYSLFKVSESSNK